MGDLDAVDLTAGVGVRVEVDEAYGAVLCGAGTDVGLGDRVVAAQDDRDCARGDDLADHALDGRVRRARIAGNDRGVAVVDHA